jgi:hypothetical protein
MKLSSKFFTVSEMQCVLKVPLGVSSESKAAKALMPHFEKALQAAEKRSEHFIADLESKSAALEKMLIAFNARPASDRTPVNYERLLAFVKTINDEIALLWKRWTEVHAPKFADAALEASLKSARDKGVQDLADSKKGAVGEVSKLPLIQLVAGMGAIATGGAPAAVLGAVKVAAAYLEHERNTQRELQLYSDTQKDVLRDLAAFSNAINAMELRIKRVDVHRTSLETMIIENTHEAHKLNREVALLKSGAAGNAIREMEALHAALAETARSTQALTAQIIDPAPLEASIEAIKIEQAKMAAHLKLAASRAEAANKDVVAILKAVKEFGDILSSLAKLV